MKKSIYVGCVKKLVKLQNSTLVSYKYYPISLFIKLSKKFNLNITKCLQESTLNFNNTADIVKCYKITFHYKFLKRKEFYNDFARFSMNYVIEKYFIIKGV